jgi:hypothetical protein
MMHFERISAIHEVGLAEEVSLAGEESEILVSPRESLLHFSWIC